MDKYENYSQKLFNSQHKFYPNDSNFNMFSDIENDEILSYNNYNLNPDFLKAEILDNSQQRRYQMNQNRNLSNKNYINNQKLNIQMKNINQRKEYQINQPNIKINMGLNVRNQPNNINNINMNLAKNRQNFYNYNMMNNNKVMNNYMGNNYDIQDLDINEDGDEDEDEDVNEDEAIVYIYQPKFDIAQNKYIQNKNYVNEGKRMINNNQMNNARRNNMKMNMMNNANNNRYKNVNIKNGMEFNKNNIINNNQNKNNNRKMNQNVYTRSAYELNINNLIQNINNNNMVNNNMRNINRPLNPQMANMQKKNNNFNNNNALRNRQNNYFKNIPNKRTNQIGNIANNNNINKQYLNYNRNIPKNQTNMNQRIINQNSQNEEDIDINLSNIAEDLIEVGNTIKKGNKLEKNKIKYNGKADNNIGTNIGQSKMKNNYDIPLQISSKRNEIEEKFDFGCQTLPELEQTSGKNNNADQKEQNILKPKVEKVEIGTDVQASLLKFIDPSQFKFKTSVNNYQSKNETNNINYEENDNNINDEKDFNINEKNDNNYNINEENDFKIHESDNIINEENYFKNNEENDYKINEENNLENKENEQIDNKNEYLISQASENPFQQNEKESKESKEIGEGDIGKINSNIKVKESLILNGDINEDDFGKYIDDDSESERQLDSENIKEKRHIKIDLDKNNYFNFLKDDLIKYCQIRKGINGNLEEFIPKEERKIDIFKTDLFLAPKSTIKRYNKSDIKINKEYILCENLTEEQIIPELFEDSNLCENEPDQYARELAASLRSSIDKSTNSSINNSIKQSNADNIYDSIHGSTLKNSTGKGILNRLTQFYGSKNLEIIDEK